MPRLKQVIAAAATIAAIVCIPVAPASAHGLHPFWFGRGLVGAVVGLATLPLVIASAAISAVTEPQGPGYDGPRGYDAPRAYAPPAYAAPPAYYPAPQSYYAPRAYYPRAPAYYAAPRAYYAPRGYSAPRSGYGGQGGNRSGGYGYPRR